MKATASIISLIISMSTAGQKPLNFKPLKIGDSVPDIEFRLMNSDRETVKLSNYKGKLVILDFWATWCGGCISGFRKADSLQKALGDKIQILLVNSSIREVPDTKEKLNAFYTKWISRFPNFSVPIAYNDTMAFSLFLHSGIPHYAWISPEGNLVYSTTGESLTMEKINQYLGGQNLNTAVKDGYLLDAFYFDGITAINVNELDNYSFFKKGRIENVNSINTSSGIGAGKDFKTTRIVIRNKSLISIYREVIKKSKDIYFKDKRWYFEVDTSIMNLEMYSYDLLIKPNESDNIYTIMLGELNRYTDYIAGIEKRKVKSLVLVRISREDKLKATGKKYGVKLSPFDNPKYLYNSELKRLISNLDRRKGIKIPILDETGYTGKVDIEFNYYGDDIQKLRKELQRYDLDLIEAEREIEMFVIRDKNISK